MTTQQIPPSGQTGSQRWITSTASIIDGVEYPDTDDEPLGDSLLHAIAMIAFKLKLDRWFTGRRDVLVGIDQFVYWIKGNNRDFIAPDVYVGIGVPEDRTIGERTSYRVWEERVPPTFVAEFNSRSTWRNDLTGKFPTYATIGVTEYAVYDPTGTLVHPPLQLYRLEKDHYTRVPPEANGMVWCETLGLWLEWSYGDLVVRTPPNREVLLTPMDQLEIETIARNLAETRAAAAEATAQIEAEARQHAEAQAATEAEARQRAEAQAATEAAARQRAEAQAATEAEARRRAEAQATTEAAARQRAETHAATEAAARRAAEARIRELEALLAPQQPDTTPRNESEG